MLTDERKEIFCQAYALKHNATEAAMTAGYGGTCKRTANNKGSMLLKDAEIQERIREIDANAADEAGATKTFIVNETLRLLKEATEDGDRRTQSRMIDLLSKYQSMQMQKVVADVDATVEVTIGNPEYAK